MPQALPAAVRQDLAAHGDVRGQAAAERAQQQRLAASCRERVGVSGSAEEQLLQQKGE